LRHLYFLSMLLFFAISGCKGTKHDKDDRVVARVGNRQLKHSELKSLLIEGASSKDSFVIVDGYMQNWIRESLMILEAEKYVAVDINIDKLVDEYRSSLLVDNYEKRIVEKQLDTVVENQELVNYYDTHKSQFVLSQPVMKSIISKIALNVKGIDNVEKALGKSDLGEAMILVKEKSSFCYLDTSAWLTIEDVKSKIPTKMADDNDFDTKKTYKHKDKESQYFVKIVKIYHEGDVPPLSYIKDKIAKVILNERKTNLLKQLRKKLYDEGVQNKKIEIISNS
jgi:hypothetical protein